MKGLKMNCFRTFALVLVALAWLLAGHATAITVDLVAEKVDVTMSTTGEIIPMWGYRLATDPPGSATVPGPMISAVAGDSLTINLTNNLDQAPPGLVEPTSIMIPGQQATEAGAMVPTWTDGETGSRTLPEQRVRSFTHEAAPGGAATYEWSVLTPGTFLIQSATHPAVQMQMGLYAVLKVDTAPGEIYPGITYDSEQVLVFSEIDPMLHVAVATGNYGPGQAKTSTMDYHPTYFLLNGQPYAEAGDFAITGVAGTDILVRMVNAGLDIKVPVLQGEYMTVLAEDGIPLPFTYERYSQVLGAGKTMDAIIESAAAASIPFYDRRAAFSTAMPQTVAPSTLLSPNGGEILTAGEVTNVQWTIFPNAAFYRLRYSVDNGATWSFVTRVDGATSYGWTVPNVNSTTVLFRVTAYNAGGGWLGRDDSDAVFTILPISTLLQPNGGEVLTGGQVYNVMWAAFPDAAFYRLRYSVDNGATWSFVTRVDGATSYDWTVPNVNSTTVLFRVTAYNAGGGWLGRDDSDAVFTIQPISTLLQPDGGEVLTVGQAYNVMWAAFPDAAFYRLRYSVDNGATWSFVTRVDGATSYLWTVPNENSSTVLFRVTAHNAGGGWLGRDDSDEPFTIAPLVP